MSEKEYSSRRNELESRITSLEDGKARAIGDISRLRDQLETMKLEKKANVLAGEVEALREEMKSLEQEIAVQAQEPVPAPARVQALEPVPAPTQVQAEVQPN